MGTMVKALPLVVNALGQLAKGLNKIPLPEGSPLVNTPRRSTADLLRQAQRKINKGQDRKAVLGQLQTSTARKPAAVVAPPPPPPSSPAAVATASGNGGAGFSGNVATRLGDASNPGWSSAAPTAPKSVQ